ncbi:UNVERIFIED_CONTAM: hypothetical protein O8I53_07980 [Campylobacter lari]
MESYGATNVLQEILTYKSDDINGRNQLYSALVSGRELPKPGIPESFNVLSYELKGLGMKLDVTTEDANDDDMQHFDITSDIQGGLNE